MPGQSLQPGDILMGALIIIIISNVVTPYTGHIGQRLTKDTITASTQRVALRYSPVRAFGTPGTLVAPLVTGGLTAHNISPSLSVVAVRRPHAQRRPRRHISRRGAERQAPSCSRGCRVMELLGEVERVSVTPAQSTPARCGPLTEMERYCVR